MTNEIVPTQKAEIVSSVPGRMEIAIPSGRKMQARPQEIGRLRAGEEHTDPKRPGKPLKAWRVTSKHKDVVESYAERFGGEVKAFDSPMSEDEWQVYTDAKEIPLELIEEQYTPFSWAMEQWGASGVQVRCNELEKLERVTYEEKVKGKKQNLERWEVSPCTCNLDAPECKRALRVNFLDPELLRLGTMRFETGGMPTGNDIIGQYSLGLRMEAKGRGIKAVMRLEPTSRRVLKTADNVSGRRNYIAAVLDISFEGRAVRNAQPSLWGGFWARMTEHGLESDYIKHLLKLKGYDLTFANPETGEIGESLNAMIADGMMPDDVAALVIKLDAKAKSIPADTSRDSVPQPETPITEVVAASKTDSKPDTVPAEDTSPGWIMRIEAAVKSKNALELNRVINAAIKELGTDSQDWKIFKKRYDEALDELGLVSDDA
jgi:hypothetical protein